MLVRIAARNLVQARRRSFFLALALALVTMLLVLLMSLSSGLLDTMVRSATILASGHVNVAGFYKAKSSDANPIVTKKAELRAFVEANTEGVDYVIDRARGWARVISDTASINSGLTGIDAEEEFRLFETLQLAKESDYKAGGRDEIVGDPRQMSRKNTAMLFAKQAERLEVGIGDKITISVETLRGARNTAEFEVVAIARDLGMLSNWSVFTDKAGLLDLYRLEEDVTGAIQIYLEDDDRASEVMGQLRNKLDEAGYTLMEHDPRAFWAKFEVVAGEDWTGQRLDLTVWRDEVFYMETILSSIDVISFVLITILVVIITAGIANSMSMSVRERTTEVGTLRAIGMSRGRVLTMFLLEALILGLVATSIGGVLGTVLAQGLDAARINVPQEAMQTVLLSDTLHLVAEPRAVITAILAFTAMAGLAAVWPAFRASRLQPVTAIQHIK